MTTRTKNCPKSHVYVSSLPIGAKFILKMSCLLLHGTVIRHSVGQTTVRWDESSTTGISPKTAVKPLEEKCL
jgi:hypothetical protein